MFRYELRLNKDRIPGLVKSGDLVCENKEYNNPEKIADMLEETLHLSSCAEEYAYMLAFDTKYHPLGIFEISHGTVGASMLGCRELFVRALLCGAVSIVVAHNHPSLDVTPSKEDLQVAKRIKEAGKLIGVELSDFLIIGNGYCSFSAEGIM